MTLDHKVLLEHRVLLGIKAYKAQLEHEGLMVAQAHEGLMVAQALKVTLDLRVLKAQLELKGRRVTLVWVGLQDLKVKGVR